MNILTSEHVIAFLAITQLVILIGVIRVFKKIEKTEKSNWFVTKI
jgi:hypothetical protein